MSIYKKLASVKANIGKLTKDTSNPFFKSKYADINQLIEMTDPVLLEAGIITLQPIIDGHLVTKLVDVESGETIESGLKLPESNDPQKVGSAITYFRRYTLKSLLGIAEEDDDANRASGHSSRNQQAPAPKAKPALVKDSEDWRKVVAYLSSQGGEVKDHTATIAKKFTLSQAVIDALKVAVTSAKGANEVPVETLDALSSAPDMASLTQIYNDCTELHTNRSFTEAYAKRQKELAKPKGGKS